jgi:hypothetical protein
LENKRQKVTEVALPSFMTTLDQKTIDGLTDENAVISCGVEEEVLYFLTRNLELRHIKPNGNLRPRECFPTKDGKKVILYFIGIEEPCTIDSFVLFKNSQSSLLANSSLFFNNNYICSLDVDRIDYE